MTLRPAFAAQVSHDTVVVPMLFCRYDPKLVEGFKVDPKSGFLTGERFSESQEIQGKQLLLQP